MKRSLIACAFLAIAAASGCAQAAKQPEPNTLAAPLTIAAPVSKFEAFCRGMATFSKGGAQFRLDGQPEQAVYRRVKAATMDQGAAPGIARLALLFAVVGYRSQMSPAQAEAWGYARCMDNVQKAIRRNSI